VSSHLKLSVLTPERRLVENVLVEEVMLPTSEGQIQLLPGHASLIGTLETGFFRFSAPEKPETFGVISSGFFQVKEGEVYVMAETLELKVEIDVERAKKAQQQAEETLKAAELDDHQFKKYQLKLQRSLIRQQIATHGHD
jgi:F-type H+-transporting ATPase subunit epsilon